MHFCLYEIKWSSMRSPPPLVHVLVPHTYSLISQCTTQHRVKVVKRLEKEGWEGAASAMDEPSVAYRLFLAFLWGIKGPKMAKRSTPRRLWDFVVSRYVRASGSIRFIKVRMRVKSLRMAIHVTQPSSICK